jgi:hypothetical protein
MVPNAFKDVHLHNARAGMLRFAMLPTVLSQFKKTWFFNIKNIVKLGFFINITKSNASILKVCLSVSGPQLWFCDSKASSLCTHGYIHSIVPQKTHFLILNAFIVNVYSLIMTQLGACERH